MRNVVRTLARGTFIATLAISCALFGARTAHAQLVVAESGPALVTQNLTLVESITSAVQNSAQVTKDYVLDTLAWQVANLAIQSMTKSLVNWINSGFNGSPAFVTDLKANLRGVEDAVARRFFTELSVEVSGMARSPFQDRVLDAVRLGYYLRTSPESFYTRNPYTLNQVSPNDRAFLAGDFSQGGWNAWFATVMNPQNNPYGAEILANEALSSAVASASGERLQELSWNRGFLSWRGDCTQFAPNGRDAVEMAEATADLMAEDKCLNYSIKTPGSVIMEQLNTQLGSGVNRLVSADEFNEVIGALLNQLVLQVVGGGDGGGLAGVSQPSSGGGSSYLDRATAPSQSGNTTSGIQGTFSSTVVSQRQTMETYRANWERIRVAADEAQRECSDGEGEIAAVQARANVALGKANVAIAALDSIQARSVAANQQGGNQTSALVSVTNDYTQLLASPTLPTAQEISEAQIQSQDTGDASPPSLYTRMRELSDSRTCSS